MGGRARRGPAALTRLAATGISTAGGLALVGVMAASTGPPAPTADAASVSGPAVSEPQPSVAPPGSVVIIEVHRTVYVDEAGNPVDPASVSSTVAAPGVGTTPTTGPRRSTTTTTPGRVTSTTAAVPRASTTTTSSAPRCQGSNCP